MIAKKNILFSLLLLPILLTPFIYSNELYNGVISAKQIWFYGAMALLMAGTAIHLFFSKKPLQLSLNKIDIALLLFYSYLTVRAATTPYMPLLHNQRWINWTLCVVLYFILKRIFYNERFYNEELKIKNEDEAPSGTMTRPPILNSSFFIINFLILTALGQAIWGLLQLYGFLPSFNSNFKITGTFFNPAPYALYLAVIFPLALGKALINEKMKNESNEKMKKLFPSFLHYFHYFHFFSSFISSFFNSFIPKITVIAILLVLPATMIRAAWLGAIAGSLVVLQYKYHFIQTIKQFLNSRTKKYLAMALAAIIVVSLGAGLYHIKKGSSIGKLFIWEVTLGKIAEKPLFGYGVGRFEAEYNNWQAEYFQKHPKEMDGPKGMAAGNTKYCFNEFLETASEMGIIGLLLFLIMIILTINEFKNVKHMSKLEEIITPSFFISFILSLIISFPLYSIPTLVLLFIVTALVVAKVPSLKYNMQPLVVGQWSKPIVAIMLLASIFLLTTFAKSQYRGYYYWDEAYKLYDLQFYNDACQSYEKVSDQMQCNGKFIQMYGKCLAMGNDSIKAIHILTQTKNIYGDYILYATLGDVYKKAKRYTKAELMYKHATYMEPNKLYPNYLLAILYMQSGEKIKAIGKAKEILTMDAKVENMAVEEIKEGIKKLIKLTP